MYRFLTHDVVLLTMKQKCNNQIGSNVLKIFIYRQRIFKIKRYFSSTILLLSYKIETNALVTFSKVSNAFIKAIKTNTYLRFCLDFSKLLKGSFRENMCLLFVRIIMAVVHIFKN